MNDREALIAMFDRAGVKWRDYERDPADRNKVAVEAKTGLKNQGYVGFIAVFEFLPSGALDNVGVWE